MGAAGQSRWLHLRIVPAQVGVLTMLLPVSGQGKPPAGRNTREYKTLVLCEGCISLSNAEGLFEETASRSSGNFCSKDLPFKNRKSPAKNPKQSYAPNSKQGFILNLITAKNAAEWLQYYAPFGAFFHCPFPDFYYVPYPAPFLNVNETISNCLWLRICSSMIKCCHRVTALWS